MDNCLIDNVFNSKSNQVLKSFINDALIMLKEFNKLSVRGIINYPLNNYPLSIKQLSINQHGLTDCNSFSQ